MVIVNLEQFDELSVTNGEIYSGGLGPCIAVGVYDKVCKNAWMIHHPNMDVDHPLELFLKKALQGIKNKKLITVYATGASIDNIDDDCDEKCRNARQYTESILFSMFDKGQVFIDWGSPYKTTELVIDTVNDEVRKEANGNTTILNRLKPTTTEVQYDSNGEIIY